jgi:hypothetical protein
LERQHRTFNRLDPVYVTMRDASRRLLATMHQAALQSHPLVPEFHRPERGRNRYEKALARVH